MRFKWPACYFWCLKKDNYKAEWQLCLKDKCGILYFLQIWHPSFYTIKYIDMEFGISVFLNMAPLQKLVLALGTIFRGNTVCWICCFTATLQKEKNNGLAHVDSSAKDQTAKQSLLS